MLPFQLSKYTPCVLPTFTFPPTSFLIPSPNYTAHESVLNKVCWIPMEIESLQVTPNGGVFPLMSKGGEEDDKPVIQLHVPQGAVRAEGKGMVEVRYTVIADGPFKTPEGYRICSTAVYIQYSPAMTTKPFSLIHTHPLVWCSRPPSRAKLNHRLSSIL